MSSVKNNKEVTRFLRFAVVGTIGAVVDFGVFNLLSSVFCNSSCNRIHYFFYLCCCE